MRGRTLFLCVCIVVNVLGCSVVGRSPATHFYMLSASGSTPIEADTTHLSGPRVAVGPITIPAYLDRPQIVLREAKRVDVVLADFHQWSEPMADGVSRVLCEAISAKLAPRGGVAFPLRAPLQPKWRLSVDILRFDGSLAGEVTLEASWLLSNENGAEVRNGRFILRRTPENASMSALIQAESELIAALGSHLGTLIP